MRATEDHESSSKTQASAYQAPAAITFVAHVREPYPDLVPGQISHVYDNLDNLPARVDLYRRAPEAERLIALGELTRRQAKHSAASSATIAALVIASGVGLLSASLAYQGLVAQYVMLQRAQAIELAELAERHTAGNVATSARDLANETMSVLWSVVNVAPWGILLLAVITFLAVSWSKAQTARSGIARAWLAVYSEPAAEGKTQLTPPNTRNRSIFNKLTSRLRAR